MCSCFVKEDVKYILYRVSINVSDNMHRCIVDVRADVRSNIFVDSRDNIRSDAAPVGADVVTDKL
jgi:hypothetical protein